MTPTNRELVAQGAGNVVSGLIGGLPITQVIVRSSANIQSGARSKNAAIIHGLLLLVVVMLLASVLNLVPLAVLASILLVVGYKLAKPELFVEMYRLGASQFGPFVVTIVAILMTDLLTGVLLGLAVGVVVVLYRNYVNSHTIDIEQTDDAETGHVVRVRLAEQVSFLSRGALLRELSEIPHGSRVILDLSRTVEIDYDVLEILSDFEQSCVNRETVVNRIERQAAEEEELEEAAA